MVTKIKLPFKYGGFAMLGSSRLMLFALSVLVVSVLMAVLVLTEVVSFSSAESSSLSVDSPVVDSSVNVSPKPVVVPAALPVFSLQDINSGLVLANAEVVTGKLLLNVWATWCVACRQEHAFLHELSHEGVDVVGLNYRDSLTPVKQWLAELGNPYRVNLMDQQGRVGERLGVVGAPETYFVDSQGLIHYKHSGVIDRHHWTHTLSAIYDAMP